MSGLQSPDERHTWRRAPRKPEPRILNPATHEPKWVNFSVAAEFLGMDVRAMKKYIAFGDLTAELRGWRLKRIHVDELVRFKTWLRRRASSL